MPTGNGENGKDDLEDVQSVDSVDDVILLDHSHSPRPQTPMASCIKEDDWYQMTLEELAEEDIREINVFSGSLVEWGLFVNVQLQRSKLVLALVTAMLEKEGYQVNEARINEIGQAVG